MTTDQQEANRHVVHSSARAVSTGTPDPIDGRVAEDSVEQSPPNPSDRRGPAVLKGLVEPFLSSFADFALVGGDVIAEGDRMVYLDRATATPQQAFMGCPPTGEENEGIGIGISRIEDGSAAEPLTVGGTHGVTRQLGAIPNRRRFSPG